MSVTLRIFRGLLSLWAIVTIVFVAMRIVGDPVIAVLNPEDYTAEMIQRIRERWGLDGSILSQYVTYIQGLMHGSFGKSIIDGRDAWTIVAERLPMTATLIGLSTAIMIGIGMPMGILAARNVGNKLDGAIMTVTTLGFALPNIFLGLLLILLFSISLRLLPSSGSGSISHVILPVITIGVAKAAIFTRFVRSAFIDALSLHCITAARARGVSERAILWRSVLPNAITPIVTILPLLVGGMISTAAVIESVFAWPGVGRLMVEAVTQRNLAVLQVIIFLVAAVMISTNLIVDLLLPRLDPRTTTRAAR